jgi:hypothetical protein
MGEMRAKINELRCFVGRMMQVELVSFCLALLVVLLIFHLTF